MKETIVDIIESIFPKCSKLDIKSVDELGKIMSVMGLLTPLDFGRRVWEPKFEEDRRYISLVDFISELWGVSKSEILRLIKGNGLKVNNVVPEKDMKLFNLPWISLNSDWSFCVVRKGKNVFDFILMAKNNTIFEMSNEEILTEMSNLQYSIAMEGGYDVVCHMLGYYETLEEELKRRGYEEN